MPRLCMTGGGAYGISRMWPWYSNPYWIGVSIWTGRLIKLAGLSIRDTDFLSMILSNKIPTTRQGLHLADH